MKNKWSLVIHQVSQNSAEIWLGTLFDDQFMPELCEVSLEDISDPLQIHRQLIHRADWQRPFRAIRKRFYQILSFSNLTPGTRYQVHFKRAAQSVYERQIEERVLAQGELTTLPTELSQAKPFVIASGSCFYNEEDEGFVSKAYTALCHHPDPKCRPAFKFFTGDQVYLDIGIDSLTRNHTEVPTRIANDYADTWQQQRRMFRNGANWFLADDHEYWNNFPCLSGSNPYLWMIVASDKVKKAWYRAAKNGVQNVQQITPLKTFNIGQDLSFCVADLRTDRLVEGDNMRLMKPRDFNKVLIWARQLTCPGVFVTPQPLLVHPGDDDMDLSLANFTSDYQKLLQALAHSGQDIICLSGDVHYGRISQVQKFGVNNGRLIEIISSPLSNLTGLDGKIAADTAKRRSKFPSIEVKDVPQQTVSYDTPWHVSSKKVGFWPLQYRKTKEHMMTLAFEITENNKIKLTINAWLVNEQSKTGLPKLNFTKEVTLRRSV